MTPNEAEAQRTMLLTSLSGEDPMMLKVVEAIPDDRFGGYGPGINANGNFVISEIQANWSITGDPKKKVNPIAFSDAKADFNQKGFDVKASINGKIDRGSKGCPVNFDGVVKSPIYGGVAFF